jgi:hypothetical protein
MSGHAGKRRIFYVEEQLNSRRPPVTTCGKEFRVLTTVQGLPAAPNLQQAILFAQLEILRRLGAPAGQR